MIDLHITEEEKQPKKRFVSADEIMMNIFHRQIYEIEKTQQRDSESSSENATTIIRPGVFETPEEVTQENDNMVHCLICMEDHPLSTQVIYKCGHFLCPSHVADMEKSGCHRCHTCRGDPITPNDYFVTPQ